MSLLIGNAVLDNFEEDVGITPDQFNLSITIFYVSVSIIDMYQSSTYCITKGGLLVISDTKQHHAQEIHCSSMVWKKTNIVQ